MPGPKRHCHQWGAFRELRADRPYSATSFTEDLVDHAQQARARDTSIMAPSHWTIIGESNPELQGTQMLHTCL
jgi:hypothetical protein